MNRCRGHVWVHLGTSVYTLDIRYTEVHTMLKYELRPLFCKQRLTDMREHGSLGDVSRTGDSGLLACNACHQI